VSSLFVPLGVDAEAEDFFSTCRASTVVQIFKSIAGNALSTVWSRTDVNGFLGRGSMHVLSREQAKMLLRRAGGLPEDADGRPTGRLLDIGAGDGAVTTRLAPLFESVVTTEVSAPMVRRLRSRGWQCYHTDMPTPELVAGGGCGKGECVLRDGARSSAGKVGGPDCEGFDVVSLFNVLDRCDEPLTLLQQCRRLLRPGGLFLLAVVLPFCPFVEDGAAQRRPSEKLPLRGGICQHGASFEEAVTHMIEDVLRPAGFRVCSVSRVPYLCQGDVNAAFYTLDDAVLVMQRDEDISVVPPALRGKTDDVGALRARRAACRSVGGSIAEESETSLLSTVAKALHFLPGIVPCSAARTGEVKGDAPETPCRDGVKVW
jgi:SAM-dependent methyltransferase